MSSTGVSFPMRPLGIGEIFDRTITLYVRHFGLFTLIMLVVVLPVTIAQYFATAGNSLYQQILQQAGSPKPAPSPQLLSSIFQFYAVLGGVVLLQLLLVPFANAATTWAVASIYRTQRSTWRESYAAALRRWPSILGAEFMTVVIVGALLIAGALAFGAVFGVGLLALRGSTAGIAVFSVVMVLLLIAWLLWILLSTLAMGFAFNAIVVEELGTFPAIGAGFGRIFSRAELGRAVLVMLGSLAVLVALYIVIALAAATLRSFTHNLTLYEIVTAPISLISATFSALLYAVYYLDVRMRREGLDVQAALDRLE
jgi:hypothetical protein